MATLEEILINMMPFAPQIVNWCIENPAITKALKIVYPQRFISLQAIVTSFSPDYPNDEVIGIYAYDYQLRKPRFKQDFIVNRGGSYHDLVLYTRNPSGTNGASIKDINEFYSKYGRNGKYIHSHHLSLEQLPDEIKPRAQRAIKLANKLKRYGVKELSQAQIDEFYSRLMQLPDRQSHQRLPIKDH